MEGILPLQIITHQSSTPSLGENEDIFHGITYPKKSIIFYTINIPPHIPTPYRAKKCYWINVKIRFLPHIPMKIKNIIRAVGFGCSTRTQYTTIHTWEPLRKSFFSISGAIRSEYLPFPWGPWSIKLE